MNKYFLHACQWTEYERGWGSRGDGWSFHRSEEEAKEFVQSVYAERPEGRTPDNYSSADSCIVLEVSKEVYDIVQEEGDIWLGKNSKDAYKTYSFLR